MKKSIGLMILAPVFGLALTTNAVADDTFCGAVPPAIESLAPGTYDNVIVPAGLHCVIGFSGGGVTIVTGNVKVEPGAGFQALPFPGGAVTIGGSVQSDGAAFVFVLRGTTVAGNVQIKGSTGSLAGCCSGVGSGISGASVVGNAQLEENSRFVSSFSATIGGDLQLNKNTGGSQVIINTVGGNLQCKENVPAPFGFGNTVTGNMDDQCAGF